MISVEKAKLKILSNLSCWGIEQILLSRAFERVLAADVKSPVSHPLFNQSAVDGYAIRHIDLTNSNNDGNEFKKIGEIRAGNYSKFIIKFRETVRIFTGAQVPESCDTVVMQEVVNRWGEKIVIKILPLIGENVRKKGEQIKKGVNAIGKGALLNSASIGFLASLGISSVKAAKLPCVGIIVTGNEFVKSESRARRGTIFESNRIMLMTALGNLNIEPQCKSCKDDLDKLTKLIEKEIRGKDILLVSGGVSVGDYDFTEAALKRLKFNIIFHGVSQKPGKPLLFAKKKNKSVFGLPGNPRSALICFYEYVYPFIQASMGNCEPFLKNVRLPLLDEYAKKEDKALYLTSKIEGDKIRILGAQDSHMLKSFSEADSIVFLPEGKRNYTSGEIVNAHILPL
jgi:molybdopterin molybdotransferase